MNVRPLMRILAHHESTYFSEAIVDDKIKNFGLTINSIKEEDLNESMQLMNI